MIWYPYGNGRGKIQKDYLDSSWAPSSIVWSKISSEMRLLEHSIIQANLENFRMTTSYTQVWKICVIFSGDMTGFRVLGSITHFGEKKFWFPQLPQRGQWSRKKKGRRWENSVFQVTVLCMSMCHISGCFLEPSKSHIYFFYYTHIKFLFI